MAKNMFNLTSRILVFSILAMLIIAAGTVACKNGEEEILPEEVAANISEGVTIDEEGVIEFEGTVKIVEGRYVYIPEVRGFDIVIQGNLDSGDLASLVGKDIKGKGMMSEVSTSALIADTLELKNEDESYTPVFTRTEDFMLDDYVSLTAREGFAELKDLKYNENDGWEGKEQAKVYGTLEENGDTMKISLVGANSRTSGKIIINELTDFSRFYMRKLHLFDSYWFYLNVKDTVPWNTRRRTRDMFNADIICVGLF